jgi:hypothetical protein
MEYRNCIRKLAHLLLAFGLFSANADPVFAQTIPLCETNVGVPGQLLDGYHGMVYSPVAFASVRTGGAQFQAYPDLQDGQGVLVSAGGFVIAARGEGTIANENLASDEGLIQFLQSDGTLVHECRVEIVAYDPVLHDLGKIQVGDCSGTLVAGLPLLVAGHAQVWAFPEEFAENSISPVNIADTSILSSSSIYLIGKTAGMVIHARITGQVGGTNQISLCPFTIFRPNEAFGASGLKVTDLCNDVNGLPMQFAVDQIAVVPIMDDTGLTVEDYWISISAEQVIEFVGRDQAQNAWIIKGITPGTGSLTFIPKLDKPQAQGCEVVVE